jgi:glycosyltransferase involved in cell wall biosynthesis
MPPDRPLVTVVTPSFNYGRFVGDCLESVRRQTHPRIEHLFLDGGSTDSTREVVRSFEGRYDLRAAFEKDGGPADALNKGFARAAGDVFCWLNADDYWLSDAVVAEAVAALEAGADVVTAGGWYVDEGGRKIKSIRFYRPSRVTPRLRNFDTMVQPATFWRRAVHRPLREELDYVFDWALFIDMLRSGARFAPLDREWAAYRWHPAARTASDTAARRAEVAQILGEQWGEGSIQHRWARTVWAGYAAAERRRSPLLKRAMYYANAAVAVLTNNRVCAW